MARPKPTIAPSPLPTVSIGFAVSISPVPTRPNANPTPRPTPTRFVVPQGPYLVLFPSHGPSLSRTILVRGGHLPPSSAVQLLWSPGAHLSPIGTTSYTDKTGRLVSRFNIPASPPGAYRVVAQVQGVVYAAGTYVVSSDAALSVAATSAGSSLQIQVSGRGFLSHLDLVLIAYAMSGTQKPTVIGNAHAGAFGSFSVVENVRKLPPGQYILRAWATTSESAQSAEAFFQVVA